ncbi:TonB-dependent SusC/RagA subfamily outer membrane receptor [Pedobacter sp. UYP24]
MKFPFLSLLFVLATVKCSFAQNSLSQSSTGSSYSLVYKLTNAEIFKIASNRQLEINDSFLHTVVDTFKIERGLIKYKKLSYGNYLVVNAIKSKLHYQLYSVSNVNVKFLKDGKNFKFLVTDLKGNQIYDAEARINNSVTRFNKQIHAYPGKNQGKQPIITISYQGVNSYFRFYDGTEGVKKISFFSKLFKAKSVRSGRSEEDDEEKYRGTLIFNKPIYRPGDTVKFKTFLMTKSGKAIKSKMLHVYVGNTKGKEVFVTSLVPYRDGGYEGSFVLNDSLKLKLDYTQNLTFKENLHGEWRDVVLGSFKFEDYELKATNLAIRTDQQTYYPGMPATLYVKATDENGLAVPDGRIEVTLRSSSPSNFAADDVFVRDTLFATKKVLDPLGETKLVLPENIFPKADVDVQVNVVFFNSNNERIEANSNFSYKLHEGALVLILNKDSLLLDFKVNGKSQPQRAKLYAVYTDYATADSSHINLPVKIPIDGRVNRYKIRLSDGNVYEQYLWNFNSGLKPTAVLSKDSLNIHVDNKGRLPFWYTVFSNNDVVLQGYSNHLDTVFKFNSSKSAEVVLNYNWAGGIDQKSFRASYDLHPLSVSLKTPLVVYPGQTVDMEVMVSDVNGKPVPKTDITAYAHTSKFRGSQDPYLPIFEKTFIRQQKSNSVQRVQLEGQQQLEWDKWGQRLGLDTLAFYRFINASELEVFKESVKDTASVLVPFVVKGGEIEPVHIIYVDDVPVYFSQSEQLKRYAFRIKPGNHQIRLRTIDHEIAYNGNFNGGERITLAIKPSLDNTKAKVTDVSPFLTVDERDKLSKYMILLYDNFEGAKSTISDNTQTLLVNPPPNPYKRHDLLIGPLAATGLKFNSGPIHQSFNKEDGYVYGFLPDRIIKREVKPVFPLYFSMSKGNENRDYQQKPLVQNAIDSIWNNYLNSRSRSESLVKNPSITGTNYGVLKVVIDPSILKKLSYIKNTVVYTDSDKGYRYIQPGDWGALFTLKPANYRLLFLLEDNRYILVDGIEVKAYGQNYYHIKDVKVLGPDEISIGLDREIKSAGERTVESYPKDFIKQPTIAENITTLDKSLRVIRMAGSVVDAATGEPMGGAYISVQVGNVLKVIGVAQTDGKFDIMVPKRGKLTISYISYDKQVIRIRQTYNLLIKMKESRDGLYDEVVIRGYSNNNGAPGMRGSTNIRGLSTISGTGSSGSQNGSLGEEPLYILDGKVFNGKFADLAADNIQSIEVLKDKEAISLYGTAGANGVIVITSLNVSGAANGIYQQQTMRNNFSDYAFWQPRLITDENGKASFKVTFPDDITSWTTRVVAINGNKQSGIDKSEIKSFKTLSASFSAPLFALKGDSIYVIGKLMNYGLSEEQATRKFTYNGKELINGLVKFKNANIDTIAVVANGTDTDSLTFQYSMEKSNGYFDGELRKIPVFSTGVQESVGKFDVLLADTSLVYNFDPALGNVTLHAERSIFPVLLDEIEKISSYEYLCNEQLASKLKALLLERQISSSLHIAFKEERQIKVLIKKIQSAATTSNLWGWWQDSNPEYWISLHSIQALLKAGAQGYKISIDTAHMTSAILAGMAEKKQADQFYALKMLKLLKGNYSKASDWVSYFENEIIDRQKNNKAVSLIEKLQLMEMKQSLGMPVAIDWLLSIKRKTLLGNSYWGEPSNKFWDNSIQNSLLAYKILKTDGHHQSELDQIARYFLEQRRDGQWRNTYESSLILETILPELLASGLHMDETSLVLNKADKVNSFPLTKNIGAGSLTVDKKGKAPIYFTAYQQFQNPVPKKVSQDFTVNTSFLQNGVKVTQLKAGAITTLEVEVEVKADANYVMVEIPIPAGCSYYSKKQEYGGIETHREYFKNKTSVFCAGLKIGKYVFEVQLMPRYTGKYTVNPAKAELMYFPTFYGREGIKKVAIN